MNNFSLRILKKTKALRVTIYQVFAVLIIRPSVEKKKIKLNDCSAGHSEYTIARRGIAQNQTRRLAKSRNKTHI
uniref:Uncharacterized protein n=1 Tax=Glossina palpalis gambiensis TaxID=67801 RepID=A0A1B0BLC1_9MUSC